MKTRVTGCGVKQCGASCQVQFVRAAPRGTHTGVVPLAQSTSSTRTNQNGSKQATWILSAWGSAQRNEGCALPGYAAAPEGSSRAERRPFHPTRGAWARRRAAKGPVQPARGVWMWEQLLWAMAGFVLGLRSRTAFLYWWYKALYAAQQP
eukprot:938699-Rhodomonas_salina.3